MNKLDLTGQRFGRLTVLCEAEPVMYHYRDGWHKKSRWVCQCECGRIKIVLQGSLRSGKSNSCGCLGKERSIERTKIVNTKHGMSRTRLYNIFFGMHRRCYKQSDHEYQNYGGRGITISEEWRGADKFQAFYEWAVSNGYRDDLSIDRIDNDGPYAPWNCRWATTKEQSYNRRTNHVIKMRGESKTIMQWVRSLGISKMRILYWIDKGLTGDELYDKLTGGD